MKWRLGLLCAWLIATCFSPLARAEGTVKIGILHSLSGTMAISETSLCDVVPTAVEEMNASGGSNQFPMRIKISPWPQGETSPRANPMTSLRLTHKFECHYARPEP